MTASTCSRVKSNHSIISSMLAPASTFWKTMATGIRVPLKTQAPLTFPGMLSTAGHCDQSSAATEGFSFRSFYTQSPFVGVVPKTETQNAHPFKSQRQKGGAAASCQKPGTCVTLAALGGAMKALAFGVVLLIASTAFAKQHDWK